MQLISKNVLSALKCKVKYNKLFGKLFHFKNYYIFVQNRGNKINKFVCNVVILIYNIYFSKILIKCLFCVYEFQEFI